jgi:hypothetical protein
MLLDPKDQEELYKVMFWIGTIIVMLLSMVLMFWFEIH